MRNAAVPGTVSWLIVHSSSMDGRVRRRAKQLTWLILEHASQFVSSSM
jgi:hypothetical protein